MISDTLDLLHKSALVPVLRAQTRALADAALECLAQTGFDTVEITLTIPEGEDLIRAWARKGMCVGAGTVMDLDSARRCIAAGARYVVSPVLVDGLPQLCHEAGIPCMLGAFTPTEVARAEAMGADVVKVFPAKAGGGPSYISALRDVFPNTPLVPTGGVSAGNLAEFLRAGAAFVGSGGSMFDFDALARGDAEAAKARLGEFKRAVEDYQKEVQ